MCGTRRPGHIDYAQAEARVVGSMFAGLKMTSKEISEVTGKRHDHVMRDVKVDQGAIDVPNFGEISLPDYYGRPQPAYLLDFKATYVLVLGYDSVRRAKVIDRWMFLEEERAKAKKPVVQLPDFNRSGRLRRSTDSGLPDGSPRADHEQQADR